MTIDDIAEAYCPMTQKKQGNSLSQISVEANSNPTA